MITVGWQELVYLSFAAFISWCLGMVTYDCLRQHQDREVRRWERLVRYWEHETHEQGSPVDGSFSRIRWLPQDTREEDA